MEYFIASFATGFAELDLHSLMDNFVARIVDTYETYPWVIWLLLAVIVAFWLWFFYLRDTQNRKR